MLSAAITVAAIAAVTALAVGWAVRAAKKRREAFRAVAEGLGWAYTEEEAGLAAPYRHLALFKSGRPQPPRNVLRGDFGGSRMEVFDYTYVTGSGKNQSTHAQTVVHVADPALALATFELRPEGMMTKLISVFGYQDIDLPDRPAFSKRFCLRGPDEAAVRALFCDPVVDLFEASPGLSVDGDGAHLFVFRASRLVKPDELPDLLAQASAVHRIFEASAPIPPPLPAAR